jgi:3'-phosphoadenosine 5'-phosphosulfate sulfotransferase (PAPS reductase)/FAD synthetase
MEKQDYITASFSGGKDSTAMVLRMLELGEHIDEVVCCDTYKEFPAMYRHIEKVRKVVEEAGVKFTILRSEKSFDYLMFEQRVNRRDKSLEGNLGYSWAGSMSRWCTSKLKTEVIGRHISELKRQYNLIRCVGIAADEGYRLERENNRGESMRHPLVEWGWVEEKCLEYCYSKGFDWEGLYETFRKEKGRCPRVSCWCCPLQSLDDLRILRKSFPNLWEELKDMDNRTWRKFKADYTVEELEKRFAFEDERKAQGLSITNREFHRELKNLLKNN